MFDYAVKNNFFDENDHLKLKQQLLNIEYDPPNSYKREVYKGSYWHQRDVQTDSEIGNLIKDKINQHFNFKINRFDAIHFTMVGAKDALRPHTDLTENVTHQCLIYIAGDNSIYSGTGFFVEKELLDAAIGFRENKAIFFNSRTKHSPLHALQQSGEWRYSIATFFN